MGFLSSVLDILGRTVERGASRIDRMSDDDIGEKFVSKNPGMDADYFRNLAAQGHMMAEQASDRADALLMEEEEKNRR